MRSTGKGKSSSGRGERGAVETTSMLIIFPLLMLFLLLGVQATLVARANQVLKFAAQEGARAAREDGGSQAAGEEKAALILKSLDQSVFSVQPTATVSYQGGNDTVLVEVSATVVSVVPGFTPDVKQVSEGKVERFRRLGE
jgi:Flp pilus assembly protein TadG